MSVRTTDRKDVFLDTNGGSASSPKPLPVAGAGAGAGTAPVGNLWRESSYGYLQDVPEQNMEKQYESDVGSVSYHFDFNPIQRSNTTIKGGNNATLPPPLPPPAAPPSSTAAEDPPSKLIGQFLHKQQASGECCLDMELDMPELAPVSVHPQKVSFESSDSIRKRLAHKFKESPGIHSTTESPVAASEGSEVLKCSSREHDSLSRMSSFNKRKSNLFKEKTKSRLMDPPPSQKPDVSERIAAGKSGQFKSEVGKSGMLKSGIGKSGLLKSGLLGKGNQIEEEEDDPLMDDDFPEDLRDKLDIWAVLQWLSLILIISSFVCTLAIHKLRTRVLWKLLLWKWEVMVLVMICGRLVSGWIVRIVVFFIERNFLLRKRILYFVYGVRKAVQNCLWLGLVLIAWHALFDKKVEKETGSRFLKYVTKILLCLVVGTLLWLIKTLVVKVLASSFHVSTYFDRIQESLFNQYVIETLSGPPLIEIKNNEEEEESLLAEVQRLQNAGIDVPTALKAATFRSPHPNRVIGSGQLQKSPLSGTPRGSGALSNTDKERRAAITIEHLHKLNNKNVSAWNMKRLMHIIRHGGLSTLDERINDATLDVDGDADDESSVNIRSECEAKAAARKIFLNVSKPGSRFIYFDDLLRFLQEDEATKAMNIFDGAQESQKISKSCLKNWVVNAFRERRALALSLNDTKTAVNKLHRIVNVLVAAVITIIWLLMLGIATTKFLLFLSSQLVLVAFIFGNTCKTIFEAVIFLFVMHPFDVGDRCEIDGVQLVVEEMNILTTVFLRFDNQKIMIPNSVLATKAIGNYYRSPDMGDGVEYIDTKKEHWYPSPMIIFMEAEDLNKVRMAVWLCHRINHQDMGEKYLRRSMLIEEMVKIFKELDMQYRLLPVDINIRALPQVSSDRVPPSWAA
ncbi:Mechanosensitive ion channel protein 5 [Linum perenne]